LTHSITQIPPATHELRPEKKDPDESFLDKAVHRLKGWTVLPFSARTVRMRRILRPLRRVEKDLLGLTDGDLKKRIAEIGIHLKTSGLKRKYIAAAFACIREVAFRTQGMRHFDVQVMGGYAMLMGMIAEMGTGEGKTLTATLTAGTAALAGMPVHVISVNDYLTQRDAERMAPVYTFLGLSVGVVIHGMDRDARRDAYACDVCYCTNKELTFDYLKDKLVLKDRDEYMLICTGYLKGRSADVRRVMLRGLTFAIVDEADSVLVDEARTPLIISGGTDMAVERDFYKQALEMADKMSRDVHFTIDFKDRSIQLTHEGKLKLKKIIQPLGPEWRGTVRREEIVRIALSAVYLYHRDEHYLVRDEKVQIIDEFTGRVMADRTWEKGLHQLVETKEGCTLSGQRETLARMSYQKFFRRYQTLSGMTGTAKEVRNELWNVYHLPVVRIPYNRKKKRKQLPDRIHSTLVSKWKDVVGRVVEMNAMGRPVLVGTRSVAASEHIGGLLEKAGLTVRILNAQQDKGEAEIVGEAGGRGVITVATNMAGRGTDIKLTQEVIALSGLHVILTERHEAARIDRQLAGRCGRQGEPGSYEAILSLEDPIAETGIHGLVTRGLARVMRVPGGLVKWLCSKHIKNIQKKVEKRHARIRKETFRQDQKRGEMLSFSGRLE
jgi:preprotein translocase subunit SecA